ncbi:MAG TPA: bi-domain-containing oxidoreductase, partial [Nitrospiraceae bacterium]
CGGSSANHAELVAVPTNLCVKLHPDADLSHAAYNTLGAIALQGVRQADLRLGETCAVIGLGLLGQLTCLLLKAGGIRVVGIDVNPRMVKLAQEHAADLAGLRSDSGLTDGIQKFTENIGVDAVIITAAANHTDPVNFAGCIARRKGRVVIVGAVPTGFDREPYYYQKELDLRMSCSYGPGRYDPKYEQKGVDYPPAYVRWTEKRNMQAFQELLHSGKVDIGYLTTHEFALDQASSAYDLITEHTEPHVGILLRYERTPVSRESVIINRAAPSAAVSEVGLAFLGAGSYAMSHLLPNLPKETWLRKTLVMTASGLSSRTVAERFGFDGCTSDEADIFRNDAINLVFVATRHDTHAEYVTKALNHSKRVFVEKPLCVREDELVGIVAALKMSANQSNALMVGFNRRFSPLIAFIREQIGTGPMAMIYRINAGAIASDSWIQDVDKGGGRIVGEACHFIDLLTFLNGSLPTKVQAFAMPDPAGHQDTVNINLCFANGSIGTVSYFANGPKNLAKEHLEIYRSGSAAVLRDFREAEVIDRAGRRKKRLMFQDKGQAHMLRALLTSVKDGAKSPISFEEIVAVSRSTFRAVESLWSGAVLDVNAAE